MILLFDQFCWHLHYALYIQICLKRSLPQECKFNLTLKNQSYSYISRIKKKVCMFISIHVGKTFQHSFTVKIVLKLGIKGTNSSLKPRVNIVLNSEILTLSPKRETRQGCLLLY